MFVPHKEASEPKKIVSFGVTEEELGKLNKLAEPSGLSTAGLVRQMVDYILKENDKTARN